MTNSGHITGVKLALIQVMNLSIVKSGNLG